MRPVLLATILLALAGCAGRAPRTADCSPMRLRSFDLVRIQAAAKSQVETPLDLTTQYVCRHRQRDYMRASFDTRPVPQLDGSEHRQELYCDSDYGRRKPWVCTRYGEFRSVRVVSPKAAQDLSVVIPSEMDAETARRYTVNALSLLAQSGETNACPASVEGMKTLPEMRTEAEFAADTARALTSLRESLTADQSRLWLELDPDGFALSSYPLNIHFVFVTPDETLQVRCWSETVILITS